jgi:ABC-type proline/glycine betaine transport system permease subunit
VLKNAARIVSRLIIAAAALMALILAIGLATTVIEGYGRMSTWMVVRPSLIAAAFIVMASVMISYLIKKIRTRKQP